MTDRRYYLRLDTRLEPLWNQWYAWPHLIAPATAALNVANAHVKIMKSFVSSPDIHVAAVKNPSMRGGPFIDLPKSRVGDVKALLDRTLRDQAHMIEFAESVRRVNEMLDNLAKGQSLEPLYQEMPVNLRGFVELFYGLNGSASMRFIEGLLYKSAYYDPSLQSIELSLIGDDYRPFVFSTPRFEDEQHIHVSLPFESEAIDSLFRMRAEPRTFGQIKEELGLKDSQDQAFLSMLTEEPHPRTPGYAGDGVRIRYFGHACLLMETRNVTIMTDPLISYKYEAEVDRYTYEDLPEQIDYVLITHTHQDHCLFEHLLQIRHKVKTIVVPRSGGGALEDPSLKMVLNHLGFKNVREIDEMESIEIEDGTITGLPFFGEHGDLNIRTKIAHLVRLKDRSILCAADSNNIDGKLYERVHDLVGDLDVIFIGMECDGAPMSWLYGQLLTKNLERKADQSRRTNGSDFAKALDLVRRFNFKQVYVYAMGQEPWLTFITSIQYTEASKPIIESNKLVQYCRGHGVASERLYSKKEILL